MSIYPEAAGTEIKDTAPAPQVSLETTELTKQEQTAIAQHSVTMEIRREEDGSPGRIT